MVLHFGLLKTLGAPSDVTWVTKHQLLGGLICWHLAPVFSSGTAKHSKLPTSNRGCPSPADRRIAYDTLPKFKQLQMALREGAPFLLLAPANSSTPPLSRVGLAFLFWSYGAFGTLSLRSCASCAHWRHRQHLDLHANPVWAEIEWTAHVVEAQLAARRMAHRMPGRRCWNSAAPSATSLPQRIPGEVQEAPCLPYARFPAASVLMRSFLQ